MYLRHMWHLHHCLHLSQMTEQNKQKKLKIQIKKLLLRNYMCVCVCVCRFLRVSAFLLRLKNFIISFYPYLFNLLYQNLQIRKRENYTNKSLTNCACSVINLNLNSGFLPIKSEPKVFVFSVSSKPSSVFGGNSTRINRRVLGDIVVSFN